MCVPYVEKLKDKNCTVKVWIGNSKVCNNLLSFTKTIFSGNCCFNISIFTTLTYLLKTSGRKQVFDPDFTPPPPLSTPSFPNPRAHAHANKMWGFELSAFDEPETITLSEMRWIAERAALIKARVVIGPTSQSTALGALNAGRRVMRFGCPQPPLNSCCGGALTSAIMTMHSIWHEMGWIGDQKIITPARLSHFAHNNNCIQPS